jgi:RNase P/RNase MRP subunit p29
MEQPKAMSAGQRQKELLKARQRRSGDGVDRERAQQMEFRSTLGLLRALGTGERGREKMYIELKDKSIRTDNPAGYWSKQALVKSQQKGSSKSKVRAAERSRAFVPDMPEKCRYQDYLPLRKAWAEYIASLVPANVLNDRGALVKKIQNAEFLGAEVAVAMADAPSMVGLRGIVIQVTARTLRIIATDSRIRTLPLSAGVVLHVELHGRTICIEGSTLLRR